MLLTLLTLQLAAVPVAAWNEPRLELALSESHVSVRGHVASRGHADALRARFGPGRAHDEELRLHVLLPDGWRSLSASAVEALAAFDSG